MNVRTASSRPRARSIVFVHGIGVSGTYFVPFAEVCARDYSVHVLDLPGYGTTPKPPQPLTLEEMADVVADYIRTSEIDEAIIVAHSMGCQTAVHFAARHPELCAKLVLIGPTANKDERRRIAQAYRLLQDTFKEPLRANGLIFADYLRMGPLRYLKTARFMVDDTIETHLKKVSANILLVRGEKDSISPRPWMNYLCQQTTRATMVEIPAAPHAVQFSKPKELLDACDGFLRA
jgi:pimeloyl-ACP methyl ester carboxylesterase